MNKKRVGKKIRQKRQEKGYKIEKLADLCHINAGYLQQIENGSKFPALPLLITLCETLNTSPNYLLEFSEESKVQDVLSKSYTLTPYQLDAVNYLLDAFIEFEKNKREAVSD